MKSEKTRQIKYWVCKSLSVLVACGLPVFAICEHFPIWTETHGATRSIGAGGIICLIVVAIIFRKAVFDYLKEKLKLQNAPPLAVWLILIVISYILLYINQFIRDLTTVFWMGLVGCAIGTGLTYIAENWYGKKEDENGGGT